MTTGTDTSVGTHITEVQNIADEFKADVPAPATQFGWTTDTTLGVDISTVDWERIAKEEPDNVGQWILHLHRHEYPEVRQLLRLLAHTSTRQHIWPYEVPLVWDSFERSGVPCILMQIVLEKDMFSEEPNTFKSLSYSVQLLTLLSYFLSNFSLDVYRHDCSAEHHAQRNAVIWDVVSNMDRFCKAMWGLRGLIPVLPGSSDPSEMYRLSCQFHEAACLAINSFANLYKRRHGRPVPTSSYALHFILYSWTYLDMSLLVPRPLIYTLQDAACHDTVILEEVIGTCHSYYSQHLVEKICRVLKREGTVFEEVGTMAVLCSGLFQCGPVPHDAQVHVQLSGRYRGTRCRGSDECHTKRPGPRRDSEARFGKNQTIRRQVEFHSNSQLLPCTGSKEGSPHTSQFRSGPARSPA